MYHCSSKTEENSCSCKKNDAFLKPIILAENPLFRVEFDFILKGSWLKGTNF